MKKITMTEYHNWMAGMQRARVWEGKKVDGYPGFEVKEAYESPKGEEVWFLVKRGDAEPRLLGYKVSAGSLGDEVHSVEIEG